MLEYWSTGVFHHAITPPLCHFQATLFRRNEIQPEACGHLCMTIDALLALLIEKVSFFGVKL